MSAAQTSATAQTPGRLDQMLVATGLCPSRTRAAKAIAAGRVSVDGSPAPRAAQQLVAGQRLELAADAADRYVGRAAHKLIGALDTLDGIVVDGNLCLDAGASTGGFTQVLLERGARRVLSVDVGHAQLHPSLATDPRVENIEGQNVRELTAEFVPGGVDLVVGDLSFISLTLLLAPLASVTRPGGELVLMVKPQFEVGRERLARTGVVSSPRARAEAVRRVVDAALDAGLSLLAIVRSPLAGQDGNAEFFLHLRAPDAAAPAQVTAESGPAVLSTPEEIAAALAAVDYS